ncbi:MAG: hypothetical protein JRE45_07720 [Deltaproteobacteria bacterium]|nr:hypothetical protein [Deltaproteobacteria bacterium]
MKQRQILWAIVFGSMLAITGCGDDEGGSGGSGTGGSGTGGSGTGGSGTGWPAWRPTTAIQRPARVRTKGSPGAPV